jgi:hypothetical protein
VIKLIFMLASKDLPNEMPEFERWYLRYHAGEVIAKDGPFIPRFIAYRPLPVISEALAYGHYNMRVIEVWFRSIEDYYGGNSVFHFTWNGPWAMKPMVWEKMEIPRVSSCVPVPAQNVFLASKYSADEKMMIRWYTFTKYPEGVSLEEGDDWFVNVHSKEVLQQPGLIGYFSARAVQFPGRPAATWVRQSELIYENFYGWKKSVIDKPPKYTKPHWAKYDKYPFLEPYVDFASTFLAERPDIDYLKEARSFP